MAGYKHCYFLTNSMGTSLENSHKHTRTESLTRLTNGSNGQKNSKLKEKNALCSQQNSHKFIQCTKILGFISWNCQFVFVLRTKKKMFNIRLMDFLNLSTKSADLWISFIHNVTLISMRTIITHDFQLFLDKTSNSHIRIKNIYINANESNVCRFVTTT